MSTNNSATRGGDDGVPAGTTNSTVPQLGVDGGVPDGVQPSVPSAVGVGLESQLKVFSPGHDNDESCVTSVYLGNAFPNYTSKYVNLVDGDDDDDDVAKALSYKCLTPVAGSVALSVTGSVSGSVSEIPDTIHSPNVRLKNRGASKPKHSDDLNLFLEDMSSNLKPPLRGEWPSNGNNRSKPPKNHWLTFGNEKQ